MWNTSLRTTSCDACRLMNPNPWLSRLHLTEDERQTLALSLTLVPTSDYPMKLWFRGSERYFDLFVEYDDKGLSWFQFTLRGCVLDWKHGVLSAGFTNELEAVNSDMPSSRLIKGSDGAPSLAALFADMISQRKDDPFDRLFSALTG